MIQELKREDLTDDFDDIYGHLGFDGGRLARLKMTSSYFALQFLGETEWIQTETSIKIKDDRVYVVHVKDLAITIIRGPPLDIDATDVSPYRLLPPPPPPLKRRRNSQLHDINLFIARNKPILYAYRTSSNVLTNCLFGQNEHDHNEIGKMVARYKHEENHNGHTVFFCTLDSLPRVSKEFYDDVKRIFEVDGEERQHVSIYRNYGGERRGYVRVYQDHLDVIEGKFKAVSKYVTGKRYEYSMNYGPSMIICKSTLKKASVEEKELVGQLEIQDSLVLYNFPGPDDRAFALWKKTLTKTIAPGVELCLTRVYDNTGEHAWNNTRNVFVQKTTRPDNRRRRRRYPFFFQFDEQATLYYQVYLRFNQVDQNTFRYHVLRVGLPELPIKKPLKRSSAGASKQDDSKRQKKIRF